MTDIVVIRPDYELATRYGAYYQKSLVIDEAVKLGLSVTDLYKSDAVKSMFVKAIREGNVKFITGTGHGNVNVFTGQNYNYILVKGYESDAKLLENRSVSFLSCSFGDSADWWVARGCRGFFGYNRTYYFITGVFPNSRAKYFFTSHHSYDKAILAGKTQREAFEECINAYNNAIREAPYDVKYVLIWDRDSAVFKGDGNYAPFKKQSESLICKLLKWLMKIFKCRCG
ncbi:MAG: hypothetical protein QXK24_02170 [Ignisphaera sp.]